MMTIIKTIDLNINLFYSENLINFLKNFFGIDVLGMHFDNDSYIAVKKKDTIVQRRSHGSPKSPKTGESKNGVFFLIDSVFKGNADENFYNVDVLTIKNLSNIKSLLKKYNGKNIGIEFLVSDVRHCNNHELGKWFYNMKWIYDMCKKYNFQFILSSGANMYWDLVSSKIFNILLFKSDIENKKYWNDLNIWLETKKRAGIFYDTN
jgi:hypothetical protein